MEQTEAKVEQNQDLAQQSSKILGEILDLMGHEFQVEAQQQDGQRVLLNIVGDEQRELVGSKGQTLDALQYLLSRIMSNKLDSKCPVIVDDGGYRERREEALKELAQKLHEEATSTGKSLLLNPMSAHDRRVIHMALKEQQGISTRSEGDGIYRRLLIVPQ